MNPTFDAILPMKPSLPWNVFFADESDRDLDFDEGFEEDELHQSKPPSGRPLLWILLLVLIGGVAYWILNAPSPTMENPAVMDIVEDTNPASSANIQPNISTPLFREDQTVILTAETMLMGDPTNSQPGPIVAAGERMTIVDGSHQLQGWVYLVKTASGKTGWVPTKKIKSPS